MLKDLYLQILPIIIIIIYHCFNDIKRCQFFENYDFIKKSHDFMRKNVLKQKACNISNFSRKQF